MTNRSRTALLSLVLLLQAVSLPGQDRPAARLDTEARRTLVDQVCGQLARNYVFVETARAIEARLRGRLAAGAYDRYSTPAEFAAAVNRDLAETGHDRHMRFTYDPARAVQLARLQGRSADEAAATRAGELRSAERGNFGFRRVEWLPGNVGYLDFREFALARDGGATAVAALNFLAHTDAVIVDLRNNGGGEPSQIQLISSYFFSEPTHLNDLYYRAADRTEHYWTLPYVPGPRMAGADVYILTSSATFSGAEEFAYNMKNLRRATLVGERTGGGAHQTEEVVLEGDYVLRVPIGRAINPISKTNWEGTGVEPDVEVPAGEAFDRAYALALERLGAKTTDPDLRREYAWVLVDVGARAKPVRLDEAALRQCAGEYGERKVVVENGGLVWQRNASRARLTPLTETLFAFEGRDDIRLEFDRTGGPAAAMIVLNRNGSRTVLPRTK